MNDLVRSVEAFRAQGGHWPAALDPLIDQAPAFVEAYVRFAQRPHVAGVLEPKVRSLVELALAASMTHLHAPRIRSAIRQALHHGATAAELLETLQLISVIGIHACVIGMPALLQKLGALGEPPDLSNDDETRRALKADFQRKRGYWSEIWDGLLALDPESFQAFTTFSAVPWVDGTLEPKVKEFMYIAVDVSATHMYQPGIHVHFEAALRYGATAQELLEVMLLASAQGLSTLELAFPILVEEIGRARTKTDGSRHAAP